jgi:hypothetical protein
VTDNPGALEPATHRVLPDSKRRLERTIKEAKKRTRAKRSAPALKIDKKDADGVRIVQITSPHPDFEGWAHQMGDALGSTSPAFVRHQMDRLLDTLAGKNDVSGQDTVNSMLAMVDSVRPDNEIEGALAVQIAVTHEASLQMLKRVHTAEYVEHLEAYAGIATKLQRTMVAQIEALAKLRRGGEQNVNVKHVHVHEGGQAVVVRRQQFRGEGEGQRWKRRTMSCSGRQASHWLCAWH